MVQHAPDYATGPKRAVYRIYRDVRFSPDKRPYKTNASLLLTRRGLGKETGGGMYFQVDPQQVMIGGGLYAPQPEHLRVIPAHLAEHHEEFRRLLRGKALGKVFGGLQGEKTAARAGIQLRALQSRCS